MEHIIDSIPFNWVLLLTIVGEFLLPCILKYFYKGYDAKKMVMSALGSPESPVRKIYNIWLIWLGTFLSFTSIVYFTEAKDVSMIVAILQLISILIFAVGAGILSGLFSVNESKDVVPCPILPVLFPAAGIIPRICFRSQKRAFHGYAEVYAPLRSALGRRPPDV